jgi:hypothetical protein
MSLDARILAVAERFLSDRSFRLIVEPAVADLHHERDAGGFRRTLNRLAVARAVAGGAREDLLRASGELAGLILVPACYYIFLLVLCFDVLSISISADFLTVAAVILVLSFGPVMVCCWPERRARSMN